MGVALSGRFGWSRHVAVASFATVLASAAQALPNISVAPLNPDFGSGPVGVQRDLTITLTNVSLANVQISTLGFGGSTGGAPASWSNGLVGPQACNANIVLAPTGACTYLHSVIQNGPGVSTAATNLTVVINGGGDETFTLNSIALAVAPPPVSVPLFAPGVLALAVVIVATLGAGALRRRSR